MDRSEPTARRRRERGSTLVEAAFVAPLFFLLIFAVFELGFLFRNHLTVNSSAMAGARSASIGGNEPDTDFHVLQAVAHGMAAGDVKSIVTIVVYEAFEPDDGVPPGCAGPTGVSQASSGSQRGCNVYRAADLYLGLEDGDGNPTGNFGCVPGARDATWCPTSRKATVSPGSRPDSVGVYIETRHQMMTGFFGQDRILAQHRVIQIEPKRHD